MYWLHHRPGKKQTALLQTGRLLQQMTAGRLNLFLAEYKEDDLENIRKYKQVDSEVD